MTSWVGVPQLTPPSLPYSSLSPRSPLDQDPIFQIDQGIQPIFYRMPPPPVRSVNPKAKRKLDLTDESDVNIEQQPKHFYPSSPPPPTITVIPTKKQKTKVPPIQKDVLFYEHPFADILELICDISYITLNSGNVMSFHPDSKKPRVRLFPFGLFKKKDYSHSAEDLLNPWEFQILCCDLSQNNPKDFYNSFYTLKLKSEVHSSWIWTPKFNFKCTRKDYCVLFYFPALSKSYNQILENELEKHWFFEMFDVPLILSNHNQTKNTLNSRLFFPGLYCQSNNGNKCKISENIRKIGTPEASYISVPQKSLLVSGLADIQYKFSNFTTLGPSIFKTSLYTQELLVTLSQKENNILETWCQTANEATLINSSYQIEMDSDLILWLDTLIYGILSDPQFELSVYKASEEKNFKPRNYLYSKKETPFFTTGKPKTTVRNFHDADQIMENFLNDNYNTTTTSTISTSESSTYDSNSPIKSSASEQSVDNTLFDENYEEGLFNAFQNWDLNTNIEKLYKSDAHERMCASLTKGWISRILESILTKPYKQSCFHLNPQNILGLTVEGYQRQFLSSDTNVLTHESLKDIAQDETIHQNYMSRQQQSPPNSGKISCKKMLDPKTVFNNIPLSQRNKVTKLTLFDSLCVNHNANFELQKPLKFKTRPATSTSRFDVYAMLTRSKESIVVDYDKYPLSMITMPTITAESPKRQFILDMMEKMDKNINPFEPNVIKVPSLLGKKKESFKIVRLNPSDPFIDGWQEFDFQDTLYEVPQVIENPWAEGFEDF